jgi:hypothetical membrane protein
MNVRIVRLMGWFGIIAPFLAALMIFVSAGSTPGWSLTEQTLSHLGSGGFGAVLFNSGLAMIGSVMLLFGTGLYEFSDNDTVGVIGAALYILSSGIIIGLSLATIEVRPLHDQAATVLFIVLPMSVAVSSLYTWRKGLKTYAAIGFVAAVISLGVWMMARSVTALYELMVIVPIGLWQMALGYWMCKQKVPEEDL